MKPVDKFDIFEEDEVAVVLAVTPDEHFIVTKMFRPGPEKVMSDLPGGYLKGRTSLDATQQHLLTQTGYRGNIEYVNFNYENPYSTRIRHNLVAKDCVLQEGYSVNDFSGCVVELYSLNDLIKVLESGQTNDAITAYTGLRHLGYI
ncbi:MAG: hypothetical protein OHK0017_02120 [Patescibacteria group bacterium]